MLIMFALDENTCINNALADCFHPDSFSALASTVRQKIRPKPHPLRRVPRGGGFRLREGHKTRPNPSSLGHWRAKAQRAPRGRTERTQACLPPWLNMRTPWHRSGCGSIGFASEQGRCAWHHQAVIGDLRWEIPRWRRSFTAGPMCSCAALPVPSSQWSAIIITLRREC
jgi:hypothetical protein